jgi:hypothetical protein
VGIVPPIEDHEPQIDWNPTIALLNINRPGVASQVLLALKESDPIVAKDPGRC